VTAPEVAGDGTVTWRQVWMETAEALGSSQEARWLCQEVSGRDTAEWAEGLDERVGRRAMAKLDALVARRRTGEPLQYVIGSWSFRRIDVMVDRRVLIPRPETEEVVGVALDLVPSLPKPLVAVDLGTGSGVIGLSLAVEIDDDTVEVWCTDASPAALDVARANLAGIPGRAAARVRIPDAAPWFAALPAPLRGSVGLVVANPPYVGTDDELPPEVAEWEPLSALHAGPDGLDDIRAIVADAARWLVPGGALVVEIGSGQGAAVRALAAGAGLVDVQVVRDLAGLDRTLIARRPA
jgi:release factor glutamine methyltransferase